MNQEKETSQLMSFGSCNFITIKKLKGKVEKEVWVVAGNLRQNEVLELAEEGRTVAIVEGPCYAEWDCLRLGDAIIFCKNDRDALYLRHKYKTIVLTKVEVRY